MITKLDIVFFFFSSRRRHTRYWRDWSSDVCSSDLDGIPGNDDCGTMSTWAIFSMIGLYPDCPGQPYYSLTTPVFDKVTLHLDKKYYPNGDLTIETRRTAPGQQLIKSMTLGGRKLSQYRVSHDDLLRGGKLVFEVK